MLRTKISCCSIAFLTGLAIISDTDLVFSQNRPRVNGRLPAPPVLREPHKSKDARTSPDCSCPGTDKPKPKAKPIREVKNPSPTSNQTGKEYVFQAPGSVRPHNNRGNITPSTISTPPRHKASPSNPGGQLYRVLVKTNNPEVLAKIKTIEPFAFIRPGESVIQAGIFQEQRQALGRVKELANKGFSAQVVASVANHR